jgi:glutaredoxin
MPTVTLYTRRGCHLCDDAKAVIDAVHAEHPFDLAVVDVDGYPALRARYTDDVPVIAVDGRTAFKYRLTADALLARLRRATPEAP